MKEEAVNKTVLLLVLTCSLGFPRAANGVSESIGEVTGVVITTDGRPIEGAMVTVISPDDGRRVTVYTDAGGNYRVSTGYSGEVRLRVRTPYFADGVESVNSDPSSVTRMDFTIQKLAAPLALSDSLSASAHVATLDWQDGGIREAFISQCHFCHQIGNDFTRRPRAPEAWTEVLDRMEGYLVLLTNEEKRTIRDTLARDFAGAPIAAVQTYDVSPELRRARVEEWAVGDGMSFIHDADAGADGRLYGVDEGHDVIWILDPRSGAVESVALPESNLPVGGLFSGLALPIGIFTGKHGPHSLVQGEDGRFWITNALSSTLMSFEPDTGRFNEFKTYPLPRLAPNEYETPYALNVHPETGEVWITSNLSDRIFRFNPESETFISYPSPTRVTFLRDLVFTQDGKVCSSHSNLPSYAIEGGVPGFLCLDPNGQGFLDREGS